jgi:hypothetical protein
VKVGDSEMWVIVLPISQGKAEKQNSECMKNTRDGCGPGGLSNLSLSQKSVHLHSYKREISSQGQTGSCENSCFLLFFMFQK